MSSSLKSCAGCSGCQECQGRGDGYQNYGRQGNQGYQGNPDYNPPEPYQQPPKEVHIQYQTVEITTNQVNEFTRSSPVPITCPYCQKHTFTRTHAFCNILNCLCFCCTGIIPWVIFQCCRGKELFCCDAKHYCNLCNKQVGFYNAC
jgi:hypothetical protein